jgi:hypothetical protein
MADQFPCPNPACGHLFTRDELQAAQAGCPRCGFRMQGRPAGKVTAAHTPPVKTATAKPTPAAPAKPNDLPVVTAARVVVPVNLAPSVAPLAQPVAQPVATPDGARDGIDVDLVDARAAALAEPPVPGRPALAAPVTPSGAALPERPVAPRGELTRTVFRMFVVAGAVALSVCLVSGLAVLGLIGLGLADWEDLRTGQLRPKATGSADRQPVWGLVAGPKGTKEKAFKLALAKGAWTPDKDLRSRLGAMEAWRSKESDVWFAIAVKDYGTQKPRDAELLQGAIERLEQHFGQSLELAAKAEPTEFAGVPAQRLSFKGQLGVVVSWGEAVAFTHHGFGYWVFVAGPTLEDVQPHLAELKKEETGLSLVTDRKGWREQPPRTDTFASDDGAIRLTAPEGVWEKSTPPNVEFESGVLLLMGRHLKEKDNPKIAHLQVFTLDKQSDLKEAVKEAREYLQKQKNEQNTGYKLAPVGEGDGTSEFGTVEDVGNRRGRLMEAKLSLNDTPVRYYLMAVVSEPQSVYVVLFDCSWKSRPVWRQDFVDLLKTLKVGGKAA